MGTRPVTSARRHSVGPVDQPLRPTDVQFVQSGQGPIVHLAIAREFYRAAAPLTLCGRAASAAAVVPFGLNGCLTCSRKALKQGLDRLTDVTGGQVLLQQVLESTWRR